MENDIGRKLKVLRADGGAAANNLLMQFQADISDLKVFRPSSAEATARGAAFLAGLGCGFYKDRKELSSLCSAGTEFIPKMNADMRNKLICGWNRAIGRSLEWEEKQ